MPPWSNWFSSRRQLARRARPMRSVSAAAESLEARQLLSGFGIVGDSLSDEYLEEDYDYARNWVEILVDERAFDVGSQYNWGEPRRTGYEYNWARYGATSSDMIADGQHTGLAAQIAAGQVSHAVLAIGQNDFAFFNPAYEGIYTGSWSAAEIDAYQDLVVSNIETALVTLSSTGVPLVLSNIADYGVAPATRFFFPDANGRDLVTDAVVEVNGRIATLAGAYGVPLLNLFEVTKEYIGTNQSPVVSQEIGGVEITNTEGVGPTNAFVDDGIHPHTIMSAGLANLFLEGFNQGYGTSFEVFTEQEMVELEGLTYVSDTLNLDWSAYITLPPPSPFTIDGDTVTVDGTTGNDTFSFTAGATTHVVTVNGTERAFDASLVTTFVFQGRAGNDALTVTGTEWEETAVLRPRSLNLTGTGFSVSATSMESITVIGNGGSDVAALYDSSGDDEFIGRPTVASLTGTGFANEVQGFSRVDGYGRAGGTDRARMYDSAGDDLFKGRSTVSYLIGAGFVNYARGFARVDAYATESGADRAFLYDTPGVETFTGRTLLSTLAGAGFTLHARQFERVDAYSRPGDSDVASLYDSTGDDLYKGLPTVSYMTGSGKTIYARRFLQVDAWSEHGGSDRALLYDSAGDDTFVGRDLYGKMTGPGYTLNARGFARLDAYSRNGGDDRATLYDSVGNDNFKAYAAFSYLVAPTSTNYARGFGRVVAYSQNGGTDRAFFYDSQWDDTFTGNAGVATMAGDGYQNTARDFRVVFAYGGEGNDTAVFKNVGNGESLFGRDDFARLTRTGGRDTATGFDRVEARAKTGENPTSDVDPASIDYEFAEFGNWN